MLLAPLQPIALVAIEQNFDSDPHWTGHENSGPADDFGYRHSNNTGHPSDWGEIGGVFGRDSFSFYADTSPFIFFDETDRLHAGGTFVVREIPENDANQNVFLGYISTVRIPDAEDSYVVGLQFQEPNDGANFRLNAVVIWGEDDKFEVPVPGGIEPGTPYLFEFTYEPEAGLGHGTLQLRLATPEGSTIFETTQALPSKPDFQVEAFGFATRQRGTQKNRGFEIFADGIRYQNVRNNEVKDEQTGVENDAPAP